MRGHHTGLICGGFPPPLWSCRREVRVLHQTAIRGSTPDFSSRLSPEVFSTSGYFRKTVGFEIRVFPLLFELPKAIEPHLPVCQLYRWQLGPSMWTSPTTKSLDPIVVTALLVGFPGESHGPATCEFACNCTDPEAWITEESGHTRCILVENIYVYGCTVFIAFAQVTMPIYCTQSSIVTCKIFF